MDEELQEIIDNMEHIKKIKTPIDVYDLFEAMVSICDNIQLLCEKVNKI